MAIGIRTQVLVALSVVLLFGLLASYLVTSRVTRTAVLDAEVEQARQTTALAAERFSGLRMDGWTLAEALQGMRPLVEPDALYLLGRDLTPTADSDASARSFRTMVEPRDLAVGLGQGLWHRTMTGLRGQPLLVVMAPFAGRERSPGAPVVPEPAAVCVIVDLTDTLARVERIELLYLLFTAIILVLATVLGYVLLGRAVVQPIERLVRRVERVGGEARSGSLAAELGTVRTEEPPSGELGQLHTAIDAMAVQLREDRQRIQHQISELELANREIAAKQEQLVRTGKLASVGELAAGVAHEIGNPLAVLQGYLELLRDEGLSERARTDYVEVMQGSVERIGTIIRDLLDFARPPRDADEGCDAFAAVRAAAKLVAPQKRMRDIEVVVEGAAQGGLEAAQVAIPLGRLEQVLLNLLVNAADATDGRGRVWVRVEPGEVASEAVIVVRDEGGGIKTEDRDRIFDPFFTTKEPGSGTGLGLAICHSLLQTYGGRIDVESQLGRGTAFRLVLPRVERPSQALRITSARSP